MELACDQRRAWMSFGYPLCRPASRTWNNCQLRHCRNSKMTPEEEETGKTSVGAGKTGIGASGAKRGFKDEHLKVGFDIGFLPISVGCLSIYMFVYFCLSPSICLSFFVYGSVYLSVIFTIFPGNFLNTVSVFFFC